MKPLALCKRTQGGHEGWKKGRDGVKVGVVREWEKVRSVCVEERSVDCEMTALVIFRIK